MSNDSPSLDSAPGSGNLLLMLGLPIFLVGTLALMVFMAVGHQREDPGPGELAEEEIAAAAPAPETQPAAEAEPAAAADPAGDDTVPEGIDPEFWALGKKTFGTCAACHGLDGQGLKAGAAIMAPSLVGSETLLGNPERPTLVVLKGILKETNDYMQMMLPLAVLSDEEIAAVLTFLRNNWGNSAPPIAPADVAASRAKFADLEAVGGVKRGEIDAILEAHKQAP